MCGKGSKRRPENRKLVEANWPLGEPKCKDLNDVKTVTAGKMVIVEENTFMLENLMIQARTEKSHYYTANLLQEAIAEIVMLREYKFMYESLQK